MNRFITFCIAGPEIAPNVTNAAAIVDRPAPINTKPAEHIANVAENANIVPDKANNVGATGVNAHTAPTNISKDPPKAANDTATPFQSRADNIVMAVDKEIRDVAATNKAAEPAKVPLQPLSANTNIPRDPANTPNDWPTLSKFPIILSAADIIINAADTSVKPKPIAGRLEGIAIKPRVSVPRVNPIFIKPSTMVFHFNIDITFIGAIIANNAVDNIRIPAAELIIPEFFTK